VVKKYAEEGHGDRFWEIPDGINNDSTWLVSLKDGRCKLLPTKAGRGNFWFSLNNRYLVYFDVEKSCHYFSYDLSTGISKDISANIPANQLGLVNQFGENKPQ